MTAPGVEAALDQSSAAARNLTNDIARMWLTYAAAGIPDDLARALVAEYHRVACGAPVDPPAPAVSNTYYYVAGDESAEEADEE